MRDEAPPRAARHAAEPYGGYRVTALPAEDAELTHVAPGTPGGEYLRRFWHPIALAAELGAQPLPVRALGEDLVLFRTGAGALGLLHRHCSHRGTSLVYGRPTEQGIRCCYHGWLFAPDGRLLETPGEPADSKIRAGHFHGAYPVREAKGLIFAYLGPPSERPELPVYDTFVWPGTEDAALSHHFPCNWLQVHENCMDPYHATWLHARHGETQLTPAWGADPLLGWRETPLGLATTTVRRVGEMLWMTSVDAILPNLRQTGFWEDAGAERLFARSALSLWITPIDDTSSLMIGLRFFHPDTDPHGRGRKELCGKESSDVPGQSGGRPLAEQQRDPGDWEANTGQRPLAIHALERLGSTDRGIVLLRRQLREGIRHVAAGGRIAHPRAGADGAIATYVHDTVLRVPPAAGAPDDAPMREFQRGVADIVIETGGEDRAERAARIRRRLLDYRDSLAGQARAPGSRDYDSSGAKR